MQLNQQRFYQLLKNLSANLTIAAPPIWLDLQTAYQESHRKYHTLQHINECLNLFDEYRHLAEHPLAVEFALWFHDTIYHPQRLDNELQSAVWGVKVLEQGQITATLKQQVYNLIMATAHNHLPQTNDEKLLVDIDLAILAAPPTRFEQYQQQIRAEYAWVEESVYQQKRREVLIRLYNDSNIYYQPEIKAALELSACVNLQQSLML